MKQIQTIFKNHQLTSNLISHMLHNISHATISNTVIKQFVYHTNCLTNDERPNVIRIGKTNTCTARLNAVMLKTSLDIQHYNNNNNNNEKKGRKMNNKTILKKGK